MNNHKIVINSLISSVARFLFNTWAYC